jgi:hypothetical protein
MHVRTVLNAGAALRWIFAIAILGGIAMASF